MREPLPHRRRALVLGVLVPACCYLAGALVVLTLWSRMPAEVVVHIGPGGQRTGSPLEPLVLFAVLGGVGSLVLAGLSMAVGRTSMSRRIVLGIATGWAVLMVGMALGFLVPQVGTEGTPSFDLPLLVAVVVAIVAGALAAAGAGADPLLPASAPVPADALRAPEGAQHWQGAAAPAPRTRAWLLVITGAGIAGAIALGAAISSWFLAVLLVLATGLLPLSMLGWQVRVDADGLHVTSALSVFRQHVPAIEVLRADVRQVSPLGDFGGWGLRTAADPHGTVGVVVRPGEAIAVQRTGGRRFVVTVDDAERGAALLNTMADRARSGADQHSSGS